MLCNRPAKTRRVSRRLCLLSTLGFATLAQTGCVLPLVSNLMHAAGLDMIPPEYEGLEDRTVAVVVTTPSARGVDDPVARDMTARMIRELTDKVKKVQLVRAEKVEDWWDRNGWETDDLAQLGHDVKAERVLVIHLDNLKLREGGTMFRGTSDATVEVVDVESGHVVFSRLLDAYQFPKMAGQHTSETTEKRFRGVYLTMLAAEITRSFRPYDKEERVALDSAIVHG